MMRRAVSAVWAAISVWIILVCAAGTAGAQQLSAADIAAAATKTSPAAELAASVELPEGAPDYDAWALAATRAEQAIEIGQAADADLETLRAEIVTWRETFSGARGENSVRIKTLREQIAALGPEPTEDVSESETILAQRSALKTQLARLETPVLAADIAFARANAIIEGIDGLLRARQTDTFFSAGPSPIVPSFWSDAASDVASTVQAVARDAKGLVSSDVRRAELRQSAFPIMFFSLIGIVLLFRGRTWVLRAGQRFSSHATGPGRGVWDFAISLGRLVLPLVGLGSLLIGLFAAGFLENRLVHVTNLLIYVGFSFIGARWIGTQIFGEPGSHSPVLALPAPQRTEGRVETIFMGVAYGLFQFITITAAAETYSDETTAVLKTPVVLFAGVLMLRFGRLLLAHQVQSSETADEGVSFRARTLKLAARWLKLVGFVGPLLLVLGYGSLGEHVLFATALTMALVALLMVLHLFYVNLFGLIMKRSLEDAQQALVPVLVSLVTVVIAAPFFALIWGARVTELSEIWTQAGQGIRFGEGVITPSDVLWLIVVFLIGFGLTRLIQGMLKSTVLPKTKIDIGGRNAISAGVGYVGYFLAALIAVTAAGINLSSLAIVAGALSVGIGFGLQNIVSNFVSGIILLIERPISEGDWIEAGGQMGFVKDISVRSTRIETFDRTDVVVPNSDLISGVVTNYTRGNKIGRVIVPVGVGYGSDTRRVAEILLEIVKAHPLVSVNPEPSVLFTEFGADSLNFEIRAILSDVNFKLSVHSELNHEIARRFVEEGIEVPFAQRDIWLRNPEALMAPGLRAGQNGAPMPSGAGAEPGLVTADIGDAGQGEDQSEPDENGDNDAHSEES